MRLALAFLVLGFAVIPDALARFYTQSAVATAMVNAIAPIDSNGWRPIAPGWGNDRTATFITAPGITTALSNCASHLVNRENLIRAKHGHLLTS